MGRKDFRTIRMPLRKKRNGRTVSKLPGYQKRRAEIGIAKQICPDRMFVALTYTAGKGLDSGGAGSIASQVFRGNSLFDPDFTGTGAQPTGFDQWAAFYERYRVRGSSMTVRVRAEVDASSTIFPMGVLLPKTVTTLDTNYADAAGEPYARTKMISNQEAGYPSTLKSYMTTTKILGLSKREAADVDYSALVGANPSKEWFWHFYIEDAITAGLNIKSKVYFEVTYYCEFYKRKSLSRS